MNKVRPCVVISPDAMTGSKLTTILIAAMTFHIRAHFPTRVSIEFQEKKGQIVLDQLHVIDHARVVKIMGKISGQESEQTLLILQELFS